MRFHRSSLLALTLGLVTNGPGGAPPSTVVVGSIRFDERLWGLGSVPSLTFGAASGRGPFQKVAAFLYYSDRPDAFTSSPFAPQFVGILLPGTSIDVVVDRPPERGPVNEHSHEEFVQGALFDVTTGALENVTNQDYLDIQYPAPPTVVTLDFTTDDDFSTPFVNGQDLSTPPEFGNLVSISSRQPSSGPHHQGPAIFDTNPSGPNAGSSDPDLLVGLGNAVILQENPGETVPGIFDFPDDAANGGSIVFDFSGPFLQKAEPRAIDLIDVDSTTGGVKIFLTDVLGHQRVYSVPTGWTGDRIVDGTSGFRTLDLTTLAAQPGFASTATVTSPPEYLPDEVVRLEIVELGEGAIDNLVIAHEADPLLFRGRSPARADGSGLPHR